MMLIMKNLPKLMLLLCRSLSFSAAAQSCLGEAAFQALDCVGRAHLTPLLHDKQTCCRAGVVLQERCHTFGTASWTPYLIYEEQGQDNHPNSVLGGTAG